MTCSDCKDVRTKLESLVEVLEETTEDSAKLRVEIEQLKNKECESCRALNEKLGMANDEKARLSKNLKQKEEELELVKSELADAKVASAPAAVSIPDGVDRDKIEKILKFYEITYGGASK